MEYRELLRDRRPVSAVGLGCVGLTSEYIDPNWDPKEATEVLLRAIDAGVTLFDTADSYGPYRNEALIGDVLGDRADGIMLSTKVGLVEDSETGQFTVNGSPEHIARSCRDSLQRLQIDVIDLYHLHRHDPSVPIEESWGAMKELVDEGLVRGLGICEVTVDLLERVHQVHPVDCVQSELSLWTRDVLSEVLPWTRANRASFIAYAPLGRGYLTGTITSADFDSSDIRAENPRFTEEAIERNRSIVQRIAEVAEQLGARPAQVALAWVLSLSPNVFAIPGTKRVRYLEENCGATDLELGPELLALLNELPTPFGERY